MTTRATYSTGAVQSRGAEARQRAGSSCDGRRSARLPGGGHRDRRPDRGRLQRGGYAKVLCVPADRLPDRPWIGDARLYESLGQNAPTNTNRKRPERCGEGRGAGPRPSPCGKSPSAKWSFS